MYNLLIGGEAGQGIETTVAVLQKFFKKAGYNVFTVRDFMSRVRGGHNFSLIRFGVEAIQSHSNHLDGIIALNEETAMIHKDKLKDDGFILCDSKLDIKDDRAIKIDMVEIAREIGNPRVAGSVSVGTILKLFSLELDSVEEVLSEYIKEQYVDVNIQAINKGYELAENRFSYLESDTNDYIEGMLVSGNDALSLGAMAAGLRFYSAYPMSPSTSIMEFLAREGKGSDIVVEQAEDEIAAVNMAIGASFAGAPSMTGTSGGGFSLKVEALGLSGIAEIPLVVVNVQRPGPATGLPTRTEQSDLKFVISASHGEFPRMVIALRNHEDAFYQTARALYLAEKYQIPVIILSDQYLADSSAIVKMFDIDKAHKAMENRAEDVEEGKYLRYEITESGITPRLFPGKTKNFVTADSDEHDEMGRITESAEVRNSMVEKRLRKLDLLKEELLEPEFLGPEEFDTLIVGWGSTYGPIAEAIESLNKDGEEKFAALIFGDVYPLPKKKIVECANKTNKIINVEQNATGQLAGLIREETGISCTGSILRYDGRQLSGEDIVSKIKEGI